MIIKNVKGGYDFLPKEQRIKNYINETLIKIFEEYGYNNIETPILCYYDILSDKYDSENDILKEIYKLKDQGNRLLGLRYDLTVPFAKFIALNKNKIDLPFKRYEISKAFRDGPVKVGRDREFTQCDVDVVGITGQMIEAELIMIYVKAFEKLDIDIIIKYNSRNLMNGIIEEIGINKNLIQKVTTIIDKINKISKEEFKENLIDIGINIKQIKTLNECFNLSLKELKNKFKDTRNEKIITGIKELTELEKYLKALKISHLCSFTPSLVRGQNYYTGNIFEVYDKSGTITSSLGGGGRYDNMITNFINDNSKYPAVGISFGLSPIYELIKNRKEFTENSNIDIFIIPINTKVESLLLATTLRSKGYKVEIDFKDRKLKKNMKYADKENIPYVIVLGEDELKKKTITIKDMKNKNDKEVSLEKIGQYFIEK